MMIWQVPFFFKKKKHFNDSLGPLRFQTLISYHVAVLEGLVINVGHGGAWVAHVVRNVPAALVQRPTPHPPGCICQATALADGMPLRRRPSAGVVVSATRALPIGGRQINAYLHHKLQVSSFVLSIFTRLLAFLQSINPSINQLINEQINK